MPDSNVSTDPASGSPPGTPDKGPVGTNVTAEEYERRIAGMMSAKDKAEAEAKRLASELAALKQSATTIETEKAKIVTEIGAKIDAEMAKAKQFEGELNSTKALLAKAEVLLENPELIPYQELIPASTDKEAIKKALDSLKTARDRDMQAMLAKLQSGQIPPPPPSPTGPTKPMTPDEIKAYLDAAGTNTEEFRKRRDQVLRTLPPAQTTR